MQIEQHFETIDACRFCFMCRHVCTVGVVDGKESDIPRGKALILFKTLRGHIDWTPDTVDTLYRCCMCGLCETWCVGDYKPRAAVLAGRADIVAAGKEPERVRQIKDNVLHTGNPFGLPAEDRFKALGAENLFRPNADVLYYVGCDAAYRQPQIARAMLGLFERAKADVALLRNERSTGKPLSLLGYPEEARAVAADLAEQIRAAKPKVLVTTSPSDYDAFRTDFPAMGIDLAGIEILHATQCIDRMLAKGRLAPREDASGVVTFLDDTYLGRSYGLFDEPRRILGAVSGLELREMGWTRELAHSCGEPGGIFQQVQPELSQRLAARVLDEAAATGADTLVTACPATLSILQQANQTDLAVKDIVEMV